MAKPSKEQIQKIAISVILLVMFVAAYFTFLLQPLQKKSAAARIEIDDFRAKIGEADQQIKTTQSLSETAVQSQEVLSYFASMVPEGSPIAWFPLKILSFFQRYDLADVSARQNVVRPAPGEMLETYQVMDWNVEIPAASFLPLGIALTALENEEPLMEITSLRIEINGQTPELQRVSFSLANVLKR